MEKVIRIQVHSLYGARQANEFLSKRNQSEIVSVTPIVVDNEVVFIVVSKDKIKGEG